MHTHRHQSTFPAVSQGRFHADRNGVGFAEFFQVTNDSRGFLKLALAAQFRGETQRACALVALSYAAKAEEIA